MSAVLDLADLAAEQWGLVTSAQARDLDVSAQAIARLASQGGLERMAHGVYRVTGAPPSPLDDLRAAWLALDPARRASERLRDETPVVVSHRSAAAIHQLGDLDADQLEFTSATRKQSRRPEIRIHRGHVSPREWTVVDGLPVTSAVKTVADLAAEHIDGGHLASVVRDALTRSHVDDKQLSAELRRYAHHYGARTGDGEAVLTRFMQEAGVSMPIGRAVELAHAPSINSAAVEALRNSTALRGISEQLGALQRAIAPLTRLSEQLANSPGLQAAKAAAAGLERMPASPALQELARQHTSIMSSPGIKAIAELGNSFQSPAIQQLISQNAEISKTMSTLSRLIDESITRSELEFTEIEDHN